MNIRPRTSWLVALAFLTFVPAIRAAEPFLVVGYLPEHRLASIEPEMLEGLTDIILFSVKVTKDGLIDTKGIKPATFERMESLKKALGFRLLLSVGGGGRSEGFAEMASSPKTRAMFIAGLLSLCTAHHLDGIDLDWEHPQTDAEIANHARLLQEIHSVFEREKLKLTIAVAGWQRLTPEAINAVDIVHLMAYDSQGKHSTLLLAKKDLDRLTAKGTEPSKICLGVPFYGRDIKDSNRAFTYGQIDKKYKPSPETDEVDNIYFNGPITVAAKVKEARSRGLAGLMIWEVGQDTKGKNSLMQAVRDAVASPR